MPRGGDDGGVLQPGVLPGSRLVPPALGTAGLPGGALVRLPGLASQVRVTARPAI